jgi:succinate dehydrogenase / fumarate reductase cytochrome b subunit
METVSKHQVSRAFIWRRLHSLMGLWLVLYLIVHLLTNSQAALWMGENGAGFIRMVNRLERLPYLYAIEVMLIGVPLAIHMVWGVHRAWTAKTNSGGSNGSQPSLKYGRNRAFTWQRITSWILLFGILGHVVQMRFLDQPKRVWIENKEYSFVAVTPDRGLDELAPRLGYTLYKGGEFNEVMRVKEGRVLARADSPGTAILLMVRDTFKSPWMIGLYTVFVLAAAFHAMNGFWTFLITWGAILSFRSQRAMIPASVIEMGILAFFGLAAIYGSYWMNRYG